ncbi:MAG TPA: radical SAM family heme chaperone HemW [Thiobacillaceae bacterium]|nr:radical SAM family heme chaperone HemW [Thiobacillaceae bacterium]
MAEFTVRFAGAGLETPPPLALYIHLPWCVRKCPYCDFNSHAALHIPEAAYIDALLADLEHALPDIWGRRIHSVFFGGGTPSLFSPDGIDRILVAVRTLTGLVPGAEITLEANPGTIEAAKFAGFREAGVTRLSLGVQSFDSRQLKALGRIHGAAESYRAAELAAAHFETFNLDLMYALPGQSVAGALADVEAALTFEPPHVSAYHLMLEPNTPFGHAAPAGLPGEDAAADMQSAIDARLREAGLAHYEISAYAKPGQAARHNLNYWHFGDYLGIGAGAHSKLSFSDRIVRQMRVKHPQQYMEAVRAGGHVVEARVLGRDDLPFEFMMNALRLVDGVPTSLFEARTGLPIGTCAGALSQARERGLLELGALQLRPTRLGQHFLNDLLTLFLPD